jgi:hypothetical protein
MVDLCSLTPLSSDFLSALTAHYGKITEKPTTRLDDIAQEGFGKREKARKCLRTTGGQYSCLPWPYITPVNQNLLVQ